MIGALSVAFGALLMVALYALQQERYERRAERHRARPEPVQTRIALQTRRIARGQVLLFPAALRRDRISALVTCPECGRTSTYHDLVRGRYCPCCTSSVEHVPAS